MGVDNKLLLVHTSQFRTKGHMKYKYHVLHPQLFTNPIIRTNYKVFQTKRSKEWLYLRANNLKEDMLAENLHAVKPAKIPGGMGWGLRRLHV